MSDCVFCKIVAGQIPSIKVYEDADVLAFKDISPQAPVHVLVIPKRHIRSVAELGESDAALLGRIFQGVQKVAAETGISSSGYRVVSNSGPDSGQVVFHLHFHVLGGAVLRKMG